MSYEWRTPKYLTMQATPWELKGYRRKPGRPRIINWTDIVKNMDITWEEAKELAADRT